MIKWSCNVSIFVFFSNALLLVLRNQDLSTSSLQRALKPDEEDGASLTAKDGTKWREVQIGEQSSGKIANHNIVRGMF